MKKYRILTPEILKDFVDKGTLRKPTQKEFEEMNTFRVPDLLDVPDPLLSEPAAFPLFDKNTGRYLAYKGKVIWFCKCGDEIMIANKKELGLE